MKKDYSSIPNGQSGAKRPRKVLAMTLFVLMVSGFALLGAESAMAQSKGVSGQVIDIKGEPVVGATVRIKGTSTVAVSDVDGKFRLPDADGKAVLEFRLIGFVAQEAQVSNRSSFTVTMEEEAFELDATIVIGYGKTSERRLTAAVSTIKAESLQGLPTTSITQSLAGRAPGLIVTQSGGGINANGSVSIRGGGQPLVVINNVVSSYNDFVLINPEDIATFSVLKDAAATAVYGARAGDGIIVITTKQGSGKTKIRFTADFMLTQPVLLEGKMSSYDRAMADNAVLGLYGLDPKYTADVVEKYRTGSDPWNYPNFDWQAAGLKPFAPQQKYNLSLNGGTEANSYYFSLGVMDQGTLFKENTNTQQRYNFRFSQSSLIKDIGLRISPSIEGYLENTNAPLNDFAPDGIDNYYYRVFGHIQNQSPMSTGRNEFGQLYDMSDNPLVEMSGDGGYHRRSNTRVRGQLDLNWALPWVEGLELRATGNVSTFFSNNKKWKSTAPMFDLLGNKVVDKARSLHKEFGKSLDWTLQMFASYDRTFGGKHYVSATVGYEAYSYMSDNLWGSRDGYVLPIEQMTYGASASQKNGSGESKEGRAGWVGRFKYGYDNRYIGEFTMRYDGSDLFPADKRWGMFYSGSLAWNISNEKFFEELKDRNILNYLKLRGSYGQTGLNSGVDRYAYLSSYGYNANGYMVDGKLYPTVWEGNLPSPNISWYTRNTLDLGLDFESLSGRLRGSFSYYYMVTTGYLAAPVGDTYSMPLGMSLPKVLSDGEHRREGVDLGLSWNDVTGGGFTYNVGGNLTYFDELVAKPWDEGLSDLKNPYKRKAQQTGYYKTGYENLGYYANSDDVMNSVRRTAASNLTAGDLKYRDFNGNGQIDGDDFVHIGQSGDKPRISYGVFGNFGYKGAFLNILIQGAGSRDMEISTDLQGGLGQQNRYVYPYQLDYWTPSNTSAKYPRPQSNASSSGNNNYVTHDFWLIDAAYVRLKTVELGYDFKHTLLKNVNWLSSLKLTFSGNNLLTFSEATDYGYDPETGSTSGYAYPTVRTFAFGLSFGF